MNIKETGHWMRLTTLTAVFLLAWAAAPPGSSASAGAGEPMGLRGYSDFSRKSFTLMWESAAGVGYNIYRRDTLRGTPIKINPYVLPIPVFADRINGQTYYYTIRAIDSTGLESPESLIIDSSIDIRLYFLASDQRTILIIPASAAAPLQSSKNEWGVPLTITMTEEPADGVVRSLNFQFVRGDNGKAVKGVSLSRCEAAVSIGYNSIGGQLTPGAPNSIPSAADLPMPESPEQLLVYWNNGVQWIKIGGTLDHEAGTINIASSQLGRYQLRVAARAPALALEKSNIFPSLFTPNGDGYNDQLYFVLENPNSAAVRGEIHDLSGRFVAELTPGQAGGIGTTLLWNGHDSSGSTVSSGLYIYRVVGDGKEITGTVAVAR